MSNFLYNIGIFVYVLGIKMASVFNLKAKLWVQGRRDWRKRYATNWKLQNIDYQACVWIHCASLGEFEQGRPLIEALKQKYSTIKIVLTFFSPSGYEIRKNYNYADYVCYLPIDTRSNALTFIELFQPNLVIFVKYEFWYHYLNILHQKRIPTLLISAIFRANQIFFKWYGNLFKSLLFKFQHIFVQNQHSATLLQSLGLQNVTVAGDTRIDRVLRLAQEAPDFPVMNAFVDNKNILIIGSSWQPDEAILLPFINQYLPADWKVIIAPHNIGESHLKHIEQGLQVSTIRYSQCTGENIEGVKVLIINNIGMLAALYRYGRIAYIGGGFGTGIHNTLEPIAFELPVIFGPKFQKFEEAIQLTQQGGAFAINNVADFQTIFSFLQIEENYTNAIIIAKQYIDNNQGATFKILHFIHHHQLLSPELQTSNNKL